MLNAQAALVRTAVSFYFDMYTSQRISQEYYLQILDVEKQVKLIFITFILNDHII